MNITKIEKKCNDIIAESKAAALRADCGEFKWSFMCGWLAYRLADAELRLESLQQEKETR